MAITKPSDKLTKADETLTLYKYDNGYLVEVSGRDLNDDWATAKILVPTLEEAFEAIRDADNLPRN